MKASELVQRMARDRDGASFASLYDRLAPAVFGLALRMLGRREEAEDVLQDVFLAMWEKAASYDASRWPAAAWALVMTRSRCLDRLRRRQVRKEGIPAGEEDADPLAGLPEPGVPMLDGLATEERRAEVCRALGALPPAQRSVLEAAYFEGLTQEQIAGRQGEPLGAVKTRMRLGMRKLAEMLSAGKINP
jgi:RNA polymerase sigma-70 factor (ECF subfamily)